MCNGFGPSLFRAWLSEAESVCTRVINVINGQRPCPWQRQGVISRAARAARALLTGHPPVELSHLLKHISKSQIVHWQLRQASDLDSDVRIRGRATLGLLSAVSSTSRPREKSNTATQCGGPSSVTSTPPSPTLHAWVWKASAKPFCRRG